MNVLEVEKLNLARFGGLFLKEPERLLDQELLSMDFLLHRCWELSQEGQRISFGNTAWKPEDIVNLHAKVQAEMDKRGFHHAINDGLTVHSQAVAKSVDSATPVATEPSVTAASDEHFLFVEGEGEETDKGIRQAFGSYGGKRVLAHKIASYVPYHKNYVEPFAGGAAVLFAKDPSPKEALNDRDGEIAFMYRFIRDHTPEDLKALERRDWVIRKEIHERLKAMKPSNDRERFYKSYYLTRSSYGKQRGGSFNPANEGVKIDFPANVARAKERLRNVTVHNKDYLKILRKYDSPETFFYIDPPYPDTYNLFDFGFKEEQFLKALSGLKAKWIVSYPAERASVFKGYEIQRVKRRNQMKGPGGNQEWVTELLVSNFPLKPLHLYVEKELGPEPEGTESLATQFLLQLEEDELEKVQAAFKSPGGKFKLFNKIIGLVPEHKRYVEAFCGGAQVFFHKKRSEEEVINDVNPDLIFAYRFIKEMTDGDLKWLKEQYWIISKTRAENLFKTKPKTPRERFYRFAYLNKAHYWGRTDVMEGVRTGDKGEGYHIKLVRRLPEIQERLKGVRIHNWDWMDVIKEYDSADTLFYLDPPYPLHWPREAGKLQAKFFKEEDLVPTLKKMRGQFLLSYELEKMPIFKGFKTYRIKTQWSGARQFGLRPKFELLVSNFPLKPSDLYVEKSLDEPIEKQVDLYEAYPDENRTYGYVIQHHWRGRNVHADLRFETADKDTLIGWTLADMVANAIKEPVETLEAARQSSKDASAFKVDFKANRFAGTTDANQLRAFPKEPMEHKWLETEGVLDPYPGPGSSPEFQGVMLIEDQGTIEYGAQKDDVHEYFPHGRLNGRLLFRRLPTPSSSEPLWVAMKPDDQTPLVLARSSVENQWLPPAGISALPILIREHIPKEFRYWETVRADQAQETRDRLVEAISTGGVAINFEGIRQIPEAR